MNEYGEIGLDVNAHSRGSLTVGSAIEYLAANGQNVLDATSINLFGPAYNAQDMANLLYITSDGTQNYVTLYNHVADPVGTYIGGNLATGGSIPSDSNLYLEMLRAAIGQANTSHNLYRVKDENFRPYLPLDVRNELINSYHAVPVRGLPVPATNQQGN
jgi:filamentous hemagglutinin